MAHEGHIKTWKLGKGFGFISPADGGGDVFCHVTNIGTREYMNIGEKVTFDIVEDERSGGKDRAVNVRGDGTGERPEDDRYSRYSRSPSRDRGRRRKRRDRSDSRDKDRSRRTRRRRDRSSSRDRY